MSEALRALWRDEGGQDMAEYSLLLGLVAVVVAAAVIILRDPIVTIFETAGGVLEGAAAGAPE